MAVPTTVQTVANSSTRQNPRHSNLHVSMFQHYPFPSLTMIPKYLPLVLRPSVNPLIWDRKSTIVWLQQLYGRKTCSLKTTEPRAPELLLFRIKSTAKVSPSPRNISLSHEFPCSISTPNPDTTQHTSPHNLTLPIKNTNAPTNCILFPHYYNIQCKFSFTYSRDQNTHISRFYLTSKTLYQVTRVLNSLK